MTARRRSFVVCPFGVAALLVTLAGGGCGDGGSGGSGAPKFKVTLAYPTPSGVVPCNEGDPAHVHPSWLAYQQVLSSISGGQTTNTSDVPAGNQQFAIMDPGACTPTNLWGNVTSGVTANGVALTSVVTVQAQQLPGSMSGLSFTVLSDGTIKP
jgi:hypothetical protein